MKLLVTADLHGTPPDSRLPAHEVWLYSMALRHAIVNVAVTNALNNRWNNPEPETEQYAPFFPSESEMIGPDFWRVARRNTGAVARPRGPAGPRAGSLPNAP